jgi:hypothetical protein
MSLTISSYDTYYELYFFPLSSALNVLFLSHPLDNANATRVFLDGCQSPCRPILQDRQVKLQPFGFRIAPED